MSTGGRGADPIAGPNWFIGSLLVGAIVGVLFGLETTSEIGVAIGLAMASVLIAIGLAAEKVVGGLRSFDRGSPGPGS